MKIGNYEYVLNKKGMEKAINKYASKGYMAFMSPLETACILDYDFPEEPPCDIHGVKIITKWLIMKMIIELVFPDKHVCYNWELKETTIRSIPKIGV